MFNVVLFVAILGQSGSLVDVIQKANKPPQTIVGTNNKVEITVPGSWVSNEGPNENAVLNLSNSSGYLKIIVGYAHTGVDRLPLQQHSQLMGNYFKDNMPDFESVSAIKECGSTKLECVYQVVTATTGEKGTTTIAASLSGEDGFYNFMAITNPGLLETYQDDIFSALRSFNETQK